MKKYLANMTLACVAAGVPIQAITEAIDKAGAKLRHAPHVPHQGRKKRLLHGSERKQYAWVNNQSLGE